MLKSVSTLTNINKTLTESVADVYLSISQDISQGASAQQQIAILCNQPSIKQKCLDCIREMKRDGKTPEQVQNICSAVCNCKIDSVNLSQNIVYNSKIFQEYNDEKKFADMIINSIAQKIDRSQSGISFSADKVKNYNEISTKLFNALKSTSFQQAMEGIKQLQTVILAGPGTITVVNMVQAIDFVSRILQTNSETSSILTDQLVTVIQAATQIADAGLSQLIKWLIRIVMMILIIILLFYAINLIFQVYSLYI